MHASRFYSLRHPLGRADEFIRPRLRRSPLRPHPAALVHFVTISDPPNSATPPTISLAHPKDPSNQPGPSQGSFTPPPTSNPADEVAQGEPSPSINDGANAALDSNPSIPAKYEHLPVDPKTNLPFPQAPASPPVHINPPFNTHRFFSELEHSFPTPIARNLMRVTRALLVDRLGRVKRDALTTQDLESQAYLFRAALSELRSETGALTRKETATMRTAATALRREVDALDTRMKEDVGTLKHEIQMDLDSRKNEARSELKRIDIQVEEVLSRALITLGELKTQVEESRWEKLKAAVGALAVLSLVIIVSMEIYVVQPKAKKRAEPSPPPLPSPDVSPHTGGEQPWTTTAGS